MESGIIVSKHLGRKVQFDVYRSPGLPAMPGDILLFNDGQDLRTMEPSRLIAAMRRQGEIRPLMMVGIHAGPRRKQEYGVAGIPDYAGRGDRAAGYTRFILHEFLPYLKKCHHVPDQARKVFAGFSLGGLSALDMAWNHPGIFSGAGVFSGALWWRSKSLADGYDDDRDRIMHRQVKEKAGRPGLRFFFECGTEDEQCDRNRNGIIDAIEDTLDLILLLKEKGYQYPGEVAYLEIAGGRHDQATWKEALPAFLRWGWPARP